MDPMADPERTDPREEPTHEQLGAVNEQSMRLAEKLEGCRERQSVGESLRQSSVGRT